MEKEEIKKNYGVKEFVMQNNELIIRIRAFIERIKLDLLGPEKEGDNDRLEPSCMLDVLNIQNNNLKSILNNLEGIMTTLNLNN